MRVLARLLGVVLLLGGIAMLVSLVVPGPADVADWMGKSCAHGNLTSDKNEQCTITDVLLVVASAPIMVLIGFVLTVALRPKDRGPITLDLSRFTRGAS